MGLLLHLSDLHLADADSPGEVTGDYKVDVLPLADRQTRTETIKSTLRQLGIALVKGGRRLDGIVVSGDVTVRGEKRGFELLPLVLGELGEALPEDPGNVLVVPGNHDVHWGTDSGSPERYESFLGLRGSGYTTALLEGVDIDSDNVLSDTASAPVLVAPDRSFVVVGMNSSNHCGVKTQVESALEPHMDELLRISKINDQTGAAIKSLLAAWNSRGFFDIARVDSGQRHHCNEALTDILAPLHANGSYPVVLATLHHQLRPVGGSEEFKPFEGVTNLGEYREWLASNDIDVVLHGHKHEEQVIKDIFLPFDRYHADEPHRLLVVSAPTIGLGQPAANWVGRLLDFSEQTPRSADFMTTLIPARNVGVRVNLEALQTEQYRVGGDDPERTGVIEAETAGDVHDMLMAYQSRLSDLPAPLICRFRDGQSANVLPPRYPDLVGDATSTNEHGVVSMQEWFEQTVDWWQRPVRGTTAAFNHGERLRRFDSGRHDQIQTAVTALSSDPSTSRAIALLVDPVTDLKPHDQPFPAFTLVQMTIRDRRLHITGYFRKQEMPHWWPINVAELASIQKWSVAKLKQDGRDVESGAICTVTAIPVAGRGAPRVVVPALDLRVEDPAGMLDLLTPLFFSTPTTKENVVALWRSVINDWRPDEELAADGDPVPVVGLKHLHAVAESLLECIGADNIADVETHKLFVQDLHELAEANDRYAAGQRSGERMERHGEWRRRVDELVERLFDRIEAIFAARGDL